MFNQFEANGELPPVTLDVERKATSRKGWISLKNLPKHLRLADGRWINVLGFEDIDAWEAFNAEFRGVVVEAEAHEAKPVAGPAQARVANPGEAEALEYIRNYTGSFGLILDLRADRRFGSRYFGLSPRQIEVVLASKAREAQWAAERAEKAERPAAGNLLRFDQVTEGMYRKDGTIFKVQRAVNGSGNLYAKVLVVDGPGEGRFEYAPGAIRRLDVTDAMTREEAAEFGHLYGVCCVCGRTLTDERSIADGIGPVCAGRQDWAS
jgi:hypothetical protein